MPFLLNLAGTVNDSIVDGPGIRFVVFAQGCSFNCTGCQNPQTHSFGTGTDILTDDLLAEITSHPLVKGVTFSGGDPFFQAASFADLAIKLKARDYEVAAYSGFTWEDVVASGTCEQLELLRHLDILVDGPFQLLRRNAMLRFRGSENQRVIDVQKSLVRECQSSGFLMEPVLCTAKRWVG